MEELVMEKPAEWPTDLTRSATWQQLLISICSRFRIRLRLLRTMTFILFDCLVLGQQIVCSCYSVYLLVFILHMNDFGKFYYSTLDFLQGRNMYGSNPATLIYLDGGRSMQFWNLNPPHFHIPVLPLALLSPGLALSIWGALSIASLMLSWALICKEIHVDLRAPWKWRVALAGTMGFSGMAATLVTGQLSFFLLLLVTLLWIHARRGNWVQAGAILGFAASVKPFLLIFLPYFALRRRFRAILVCQLAILLCYGAGVLAFGIEAHWNWLQCLKASSNWTWAAMNASIPGFLNRVLAPSPHFSPLAEMPNLLKVLSMLGAGLILSLTIAVLAFKRHPFSLDRDFALLLLAALLISPLGWIYYLWLPLGPCLALAVPAWRTRKTDRGFPALRWRNALFLGGLGALFMPLPAIFEFQPNPLAAVTLGSCYFWATLALWLSLVLDSGVRDRLAYPGAPSEVVLRRHSP